ncbi:hypothetical protein ACLKA7_007836 [Drosophila subpalustris]
MENDDYQPLLRRRRKSNLRWMESQVLEFLELVLDLVKDVPESLEKPTAQKFYAKSCLDMTNRNPSEFLRRYITMDETWIHHYIPESNRSSTEWREAGESRSKRVKASR